MARIILADDGIEFDGRTPELRPLGGAESGVIALMENLAARGHEVSVHNKCKTAITHKGVQWVPLDPAKDRLGLPEKADLYVANRGDKLISLMPDARAQAFWTHNPAEYMVKWRYLWKLWKVRPAIIFIGTYHLETFPKWAPGGRRVVMPYGLPDDFCEAEVADTIVPPRAVFTSNPLRSLDWLLERWTKDIAPSVPNAELHIFAGAATYGRVGDRKAQAMNAVLDHASSLTDKGVILRGAQPKATLLEEFKTARCMLYRGDLSETFCMALGEAQAMGVPAVVQDLGSMAERVRHEETGFVTQSDKAFSDAAIRLLTDDTLWQSQRQSALRHQRSWRWSDAVDIFETLLP